MGRSYNALQLSHDFTIRMSSTDMVMIKVQAGYHPKGWVLNDGNIMLPIAFGTFGRVKNVEEVGKAVEWAVEAGYRHIDTSYVYLNEKVIGKNIQNVIKRGIVKRDDLFITTKTLVTANFHWRSIRLNDGNKIPPIAFGTFGKISEVERMGSAVVTAVEAGYRLIDTAYFYQNEGIIGEAISNVTRRGIVKRKELFISTKLSILTGRDAVVPALKKSLAKLKLDYVDLYLIHVPRNQTTGEDFPYLDIWKGMEDAKMLGLTKSIGVANFNSSNMNRVLSNCRIRPAVNQIEVNPTMASMGLVAYCQSQNIQVMSYAPFGFAVPRPFNDKTLAPSFDDPTLVEIANKYDKGTSQVFLRYLIDRNTIPIPKSTNNEHIRSNIDIFNFRLTREEIYKISEFDINTAVYFQNGVLTAEFFTYMGRYHRGGEY